MTPTSTRAAMMRFSTLDPSRWPACLDALRDLGFDAVDLPLVWREHETAENTFDFEDGPRAINTVLDLVAERGMRAVVRLGPTCAPDAPGLGIPERVLRDRECQARTRRQNPVVVPDPPRLVPMPSVASARYRDECARWVAAACDALATHRQRGTITRLALGHGPAASRRDDCLEIDHHPDAMEYAPEHSDPLRAAVERESVLGARFLEHLAQTAIGKGFSDDALLLSVQGAALLSGVAWELMETRALLCALPPPESGSEAIWRNARAIAALSKPAHVDLHVGCSPFGTPRRASYTTPAARLALAAGLRHTTAVMGVTGHGWVGALLDARGGPRAHGPRWRELNRFAAALPEGEEIAAKMAYPYEAAAEARARTRLRPLSLGLVAQRDVMPAEFYEDDPLRAIEAQLTEGAVPWSPAPGAYHHALDGLAHVTPTLDPKGAALVRAVKTHDGVALVLVASRDVEVRVTPPPGRWTDVEGRDTAGLGVMPGESAMMLQGAVESEVRW